MGISSVYREYSREMNRAERDLLERWLATYGERPRSYAARWILVLLSVLAVASYAASRGIEGLRDAHEAGTKVVTALPLGVMMLVQIACVGGIVAVIVSRRRQRAEYEMMSKEVVPGVRAALDDGKVAVAQVEAQAVVVIQAAEDEGNGYVFDIGDGRMLFLQGQEFDEVRGDDGNWPNTAFEMVRTANGGMWLGVFGNGAPLTAERVISVTECREDADWPESGQVLEKTLDAFMAEVVA